MQYQIIIVLFIIGFQVCLMCFFFNFISRLEDRQLKKEKTYNITILS